MTITIELRNDLDTHLRQLAEERGMELEEYLAELIEKIVPAMGSRAGAELLAAWEREDAIQDPEELEERQLEWDAMKKAMNESHSSDRTLFP